MHYNLIKKEVRRVRGREGRERKGKIKNSSKESHISFSPLPVQSQTFTQPTDILYMNKGLATTFPSLGTLKKATP